MPNLADHGDDRIERVAAGRDLVHGEAGVADVGAVDEDARLIGGGERQRALGDRLAFFARQIARA